MKHLTAGILLLGLALAGEPEGPSEMDRKEAAAFMELARAALAARKEAEAEAWLDKAEAKCPLPAILEMRGHILVRRGEKEKAVRCYLRVRDAYRGVNKAGFARVNGELALISPGLLKYLEFRDKFLGQAKLAMSGYGQDALTKNLATSDVMALDEVLVGGTAPPKVEEPATGPVAVKVEAAAVGKLFRGRMAGFDPEKLGVELRYDFSDPAQLEDWGFHPEAKHAIANKALDLWGKPGLWKEEKARLRPYFRLPVTVSLSMKNKGAKLGELSLALRAGATGKKVSVTLGSHSNNKGSKVGAWGQEFALKDLGPVEAAHAYAVVLEVTADAVSVSVDGKEMLRREVKAPDDWFRVTLNTDEGRTVTFDDLVISGVLDRAALEGALRAGALPVAGTLHDPAKARPKPKPAGPKGLFNGTSLDGWVATKDWTVEEGAILWRGAAPKLGWVTLSSTRTSWNYRHFKIHLQARSTLRTVGLRLGWDTFEVETKGEPSTWRVFEFEVQGTQAKVTVDGKVIHEGPLKNKVSEIALWAKGPSGLPKEVAAFKGIKLEVLGR